MTRIRYEVVPAVIGWKIMRAGERIGWTLLKASAVEFAADICEDECEQEKQLSELTIKGRDGKIKDRRTYGRDPRRSRG